ncbi:MAG: hypothetical protein RR235_08410 [Oscillospiraceae bacterium]
MSLAVWIICFVAGLSTAAFITIWFSTAYKELTHAKSCVENAASQLQLHTKSYPQARDDPNKSNAIQGLDIARMIYQEVVKNYEHVRRKPMNHIPAFVLGFHKIEKES